MYIIQPVNTTILISKDISLTGNFKDGENVAKLDKIIQPVKAISKPRTGQLMELVEVASNLGTDQLMEPVEVASNLGSDQLIESDPGIDKLLNTGKTKN